MVTVIFGNGHGKTSSNSGQGCLHFHVVLIPLGNVSIQLFSIQLIIDSRATWIFNVGMATSLGEGKL